VSSAVFEVRGLSKRYGSAYALRDIHMTVRRGEIYGLIGGNGAGKTTLMEMIGGLVHPTSGELLLFGEKSPEGCRSARRKTGFLIEMPALYPNMNAEENLSFYCRLFGIEDAAVRIPEILRDVALTGAGRKTVAEYSLGMRQRLGLAVALLNRPGFLVLDEPTNGLDPAGIKDMRRLLEDLAHKKGVSILISSHILSELQLLADRFGFIHKGRLVKEISREGLVQAAGVQICIRTPCPQEAARAIQEELQLDTVTVTGEAELQIPKGAANMENLMSLLLQKGIPLEGISLTVPNLENYYMELIGGDRS
jgi:ABC-2 type transport system ATP-binding protein